MNVFFWTLVLIMIYIYVGYPCILYFLSKYKSSPNKNLIYTPLVTIIMSVYNEEDLIQEKINNLLSLDYPQELIEIIIITDGSDDETANIIRSNSKVKLIESKQRLGKAACVNRAVLAAHNDVLILMDVRQTVENQAIKKLVANFQNKNIGAVSGELVYREKSKTTQTTENAGFYWKYEKFIRKAESDIGSVQGVTGALYAIKKELMPVIPEGTILDDVYVPMTVIKKGLRVLFEPEAVIYDDASVNESAERKRKIRTIAGNYQLLSMNKWLMSPFDNPTFVQFFSHKILRLLSPFILSLMVLSLTFLALNNYGVIYMVMMVLFIVFMLCTYIDFVSNNVLTKLFKVNHAFMQLNFYALLGFIEYIKNKEIYLWK